MRPHFFFPTLIFCLWLTVGAAFAQRVALLVPEKSDRDLVYAELLVSGLSRSIRVLDISQSLSAFRSSDIKTPYNMTSAESRAAASVMGCEYFSRHPHRRTSPRVVFKVGILRSVSVIYLVSGRTGLLAGWWLKSFEADNQAKADQQLTLSIVAVATEISDRMENHYCG
jgi:hypothetical protein